MKVSLYSRAGAQRVAEVTITALFWAAWLYLVMPLLSLLLWFAGIHFFVEEMIARGGYEALLGELKHYGLVILGIAVTISLWVLWNRQHYGRRNLRVHQPPAVELDELAHYVGLPPEDLRVLQDRRNLHVTFDEHDRLIVSALPKRGSRSRPNERA